jgi:hypothetical protein
MMWIIQYNKKLYTEFKDLALNSIHYKLPDMHEDSLPSVYLIKCPKTEITGSRPEGAPRLEWEEGVTEDAARVLLCRNWKLTVQIGTVWRQKLWEAEG